MLMSIFKPLYVFLVLLPVVAKSQIGYDLMLKGMYKNTVPLIKYVELDSLMKANTDIILLDTREKDEYEVSHLEGAHYVGYDYFKMKRLDSIPRDKEVIVYCSVGYRSERIGEKLQKKGFTNVKNLYGGIFDWVNHDRKVVNEKGGYTEKVHPYDQLWGQWLIKGTKAYE